MARSTSIYVVTDNRSNIIRAFTVKRELRTWLERLPVPFVYTVTTVPDGTGDRAPYSVPAVEILKVTA